MRGAVDEMHLSLQQPDAVVQLSGNIEGLVGSCISGPNEGRVVSRYFGDVAVFSPAEFGVVVAGCGVGGERCCGGG